MTAEIVTRDEVVERIRALAPRFRERAAAAEDAGALSAESVADLVEAGMARLLVPRRFGGYELGLDAWLDTVLEVGRADASHAWCASLLAHVPHYVAQYDGAAQEALWADGPDVALAGSLMPAAEVTPVEGGYRVSGPGPFASGVGHSAWVLVSGLVHGEGPPEWTLFLIPRDDIAIIDTWDTVAMRATGSNTIMVQDVFVPGSHALRLADLREGTGPGGAVHASPLYRLPLTAYAPLAFVAPMLGAAQGAYEHTRDWLATRTTPMGDPLADIVSIQVRLGRAAADLDGAEMALRRIAEVAEREEQPSYELRARAMRDYSWAVERIVAAIDVLVELGGTSAFQRSSPVQRAWRDIHFAASHVSLNREANFGHWGRTALGRERPPMQPFF